MKRDMDLIRLLMLRLEALDVRAGGIISFSPDDPEIRVEGRPVEDISAHLAMIYDAGLVIGEGMTMSGDWLFRRLSPAGHDFLDAVRDPEIWKATKAGRPRWAAGRYSFLANSRGATSK